jgi:hypothetical protein
MDDFNIRLKLLEKSSLHKQRREFIHDDNNTSINPFNNDLRFWFLIKFLYRYICACVLCM